MFEVYTKEELEIIKTALSETKTETSEDKAFAILKKLAFFEGVDSKILSKCVKNIKLKRYEKYETIIEEGDIDDTIFLIVKGAVAVYKYRKYEKEKLIGVLKEGQVFGEVVYLLGVQRSATVKVSINDSLILSFRLNGDYLDSKEASASAVLIYKNIAKSLALKLDALNNRFCI